MQNYCFSALAKYLFMGVLSIVFVACSENSSSASEKSLMQQKFARKVVAEHLLMNVMVRNIDIRQLVTKFGWHRI